MYSYYFYDVEIPKIINIHLFIRKKHLIQYKNCILIVSYCDNKKNIFHKFEITNKIV